MDPESLTSYRARMKKNYKPVGEMLTILIPVLIAVTIGAAAAAGTILYLQKI